MHEAAKVAHVMRRFTRDKWGGTETVVFNLARECEEAGVPSPIFCTDMFAAPGEEQLHGVSIRRFPYTFPWLFLDEDAKAKLRLKGGSPLSWGLYRALMREPGLSIIHTHVQHRLGGIARTVARRKGIPYVVSIHGGHFTLPAEQSKKMQEPFAGKPEWGKLFGALLGARRVLEDAAAVLCVGRDEYESVQARLPGHACHYVPNGVVVRHFSEAAPEAFRARFGFRPEEKLILCLSRIDYQKNQLLLVRAFARFAAAHPAHRLVLLGAVTVEDYHAQIVREVRERGLESRVTIIPGLAPDDPVLPGAYKAAEFFVLPTVHEPFGIVILEAWAAGTPVIATRVGGIPGFTTDGANIRLFELNSEDQLLERMNEMAGSADLRGQLRCAAFAEVSARYDWSMIARQMRDIYAEAIVNHRARAGGGAKAGP